MLVLRTYTYTPASSGNSHFEKSYLVGSGFFANAYKSPKAELYREDRISFDERVV